MIYIAHRGLFNGPDSNLENTPSQIEKALAMGFHCEIDVWVTDGQLYLGHDGPVCNVQEEFLKNDKFWIHAKNLNALEWLTQQEHSYNYFWHESDQYTLTSNGFIWAYPGVPLSKNCVMVMPEHVDATLQNCVDIQCHAICSDYTNNIISLRN
jgi:hypothetical protein